ncbi:tryptase-2-like [Epinephelus fuscoguttatus]|uniref:tryptase-2-like n=1 Tax=Epinephelus fuscoguttatus TaxID=293821 RepID=UPI0020D054B2|nr:tryptase-2-like [Epinephelus fuscoguttatus]
MSPAIKLLPTEPPLHSITAMAFSRLLTVLVLIHNTGGLLGAEVRSSIVGGQDAPESRWPWMVYINITSDGVNTWRCGGTILNTEWVLTAANCLDKYPPPNLLRSMVWVGSHNLQKKSARYMGIKNIMLNPAYRNLGSYYENDIALVKLKKKLTFSKQVNKVTLPSADDIFGSSSECWITGWGNIGNNAPLPDPETLQELKIPIIPHSVCKAKYPELTSSMLCAGGMDEGKDACKGDYGGPLVCRAAGGFVQVGIMSYGSPDGCGLKGHPGVYTQVSKHLRFINDYIHHGEEASAEV